ncbi:MAG TPA: tetratricopeptide repeat protein [Chthoniobacteraceae bacterium]|jgi:tetratricopeptide (TPR) repeat protein|nr:tetratricopeptide repeat protein [Chthoniobacteraceae bacterium]
MAVKSDKEIPDEARKLWFKALQALELHNFGYVVELVRPILRETPEFLHGRTILRQAEIERIKGKKKFFGGFSAPSLKSGNIVKKDPRAAIEQAEDTLETDPFNHGANFLLRDGAMAAGYVEIASFALETVARGNPKDPKVLHELAKHYYENGLPEKAVDVYTRISELNPSDLSAVKAGKDAAARASMTSGKWEEVAASGGTKDYRDLIKNKEEAISLEQKSRVVKSEEMIDQQLNELLGKYAENEAAQQNVDLVRRIAALYEQKDDLQSAHQWYSYTAHLMNNTDPAVARKVSEIHLKIIDKSIGEYEVWLEQYGNTETAPEARATLEDLRKQKAGSLLDEARKRVERNPTDSLLRFELGEQLLAAGHPTEAIPELQQARKNPSVRLRAMNLLGECYTQKNMLDFAVRTFGEACKEMAAMDDLKKEMTYKLALLHERMGDQKSYLERLKEIYDADYGYRDVAKRVESSYEQ